MKRSTHRDWKGVAVMYRCYDVKGQLLYIGSSQNLPARIAEHRRQARWWKWHRKLRVQVFPTRLAALAAERAAVEQECPAFNSWWTGRHGDATKAGLRRQRGTA